MKAPAKFGFESIMQAVRDCKMPGQKVYLVGGAVRDLLFGKPLHDFDFVTEKGSRDLARQLRKHLSGVSFALDDERGFNRVILEQGSPEERLIDIAEFTGADLEADLRARDFTINAMAIDVDEPDVLIDPLGGKDDLKEGILELASPESFELDPLRVLRAVRMMQAYEMGFSDGTSVRLRVATNKLSAVSSERVRDELFNILNLNDNVDSLRMLWYLNILSEIFPCVPHFNPEDSNQSNIAFEERLSRVAFLEDYFAFIKTTPFDPNLPHLKKAVYELFDAWREPLQAYLETQLTKSRFLRNLLVILALVLRQNVKDGAPSSIQAIIDYYKLSNVECDYLNRIESMYLSEAFQISRQRAFTELEVYKALKALKDTAPGYVLVSLAFADAEKVKTMTDEAYAVHLANMQNLLSTWFERGREILKPEMLMNGQDVIDYANLVSGPIVGELLNKLEEAQFLGTAKTVDDAKQLIDNYLAEQ